MYNPDNVPNILRILDENVGEEEKLIRSLEGRLMKPKAKNVTRVLHDVVRLPTDDALVAVSDIGTRTVDVVRWTSGVVVRTVKFDAAPAGLAAYGRECILVTEPSMCRVIIVRWTDGTHVRSFSVEGSPASLVVCARDVVAILCSGQRLLFVRVGDGHVVRSDITAVALRGVCVVGPRASTLMAADAKGMYTFS